MDYKFIKTEYLEMVAGGDQELLKELINMFQDQVAEFNMLYLKKDFHALGLLAHKAKSSVAIMGMDSLANLLKTFEVQAREEINTDLYQSYITRFENDTRSALTELNTLIENQ
jgi:HPt (histidine-containing phosphotransfer) domain-containing protein